MKKYILASILILAMAMPVFAQVTLTGPSVSQPGNQIGLANEKEANIAPFAQAGSNVNNTFTPTNVNAVSQSQQQHSVNVNKNTSISEAEAKALAVNAGNKQTINEAVQFVGPQPIYPYLLQIIPGVVGNMTDQAPTFSVKALGKTEQVVKADSYTRGGRIVGFSRLEDYDSDLIDLIPSVMKKWRLKSTENMRISILFKMSSKTIGMGGGGGGSVSGMGGTNPMAWGTNASVLPGVAVNTADPKVILKFYLVK